MKCDQVAYYCQTLHDVRQAKAVLGLSKANWISDQVTTSSDVLQSNGQWGNFTNVAYLEFNYDLGIEIELLTYVSGPNWQMYNMARGSGIIPSHIGFHLAEGEDFPDAIERQGNYVESLFQLVQESWTMKHSNPELVSSGKRYQYKIFKIGNAAYVKYIRRILPKAAP